MVSRTRVTLNGTLGAANEESWSCGFHFTAAEVMDPTEAAAAANEIRNRLGTAWSAAAPNLRSLMSTRGTLRDVSVYSYANTGPAVSSANAALGTPIVGVNSATAPPQCAVVYSLLTGFAGASRRGRIYWPALAPAIDGSFKSTLARGSGLDVINTAILIQDALETFAPGAWGVYSPKLDVVTPVTSVRAGDVIDTQRRRRDALTELYSITAVP